MVLNQPFTTVSQKLVNYDYVDYIDGTGIVEFYGATASVDTNNANDEYILIRNQIISAETTNSTPYTSLSPAGTLTFEVTINSTQIIDGNLFISIPIYDQSGSGCAVKIDVYHYDGSTQTSIATQMQCPTVSASGYRDRTCKLPLTRQIFTAGDILQIKLTGVSNTLHLYHDPLGTKTNFARSGGTLKVYVPFLIQE